MRSNEKMERPCRFRAARIAPSDASTGRFGGRLPPDQLKGVGMPGTQGCGSGRMVLKVKLPKLHSDSVPDW